MKHRSPLQKGDHPELDASPFLDEEGKMIYQSLTGCGQWNISIGRFDTHTVFMTMSRYRTAPREGHLERVKRIYGYLRRFRHFKIRFRVDEPDYSNVPPIQDHDWEHSVYGQHEEDIAENLPEPLGKRIVLTHYFDASLMHDVLSGKAVTGICTFYNKTPVDWYCKQQATSETATYGAEFLSARKCFEMIIDHRAYLRYLGKPVGEMDYVWGDNKSMIDSSTIPESKLNKRHNILSFHYVRSMISRGYVNLQHLASEWNFADIPTKQWSYQSCYRELVQPVFHHSGNTAALFLDDTLELDVAIEEGTIFGIQVGSEKRSPGPMPGDGGKAVRACGTAQRL